MNIWQSYQRECGCLVHFVRGASRLLKDEESASHVRLPEIKDFAVVVVLACENMMKCLILRETVRQ